jgi:hypothetical protein
MNKIKIAHTFRLSPDVSQALIKLAKLPIYRSQTGAIEVLVWEKATELCLTKSITCKGNKDGHRHNRKGNNAASHDQDVQ